MNLAIDWGNTRIKAGWFDEDRLLETVRFRSSDELQERLQQHPPQHVIVSSTSQPAAELRQALDDFDGGADWLLLSPTLPVPIHNGYGTPQTLGADRLAAAAGAAALHAGYPCLVLDLGTCITADFVAPPSAEEPATFEGGLISPGLQMRLRAMHTFTARLPLPDLPTSLASADGWPPLTARNTHEALLSGAMNGMLLELNGLIHQYTNQYSDLRVIVCGGDSPLFVNRLKPGIFAVPDLVLLGLNQILLHNLSLQQSLQNVESPSST